MFSRPSFRILHIISGIKNTDIIFISIVDLKIGTLISLFLDPKDKFSFQSLHYNIIIQHKYNHYRILVFNDLEHSEKKSY